MNINFKSFNFLSIVILFTVIFISVVAAAGQKRSFTFNAKVKTDSAEATLLTTKTSFSPGENVAVSGSGFGKSEQVAVSVEQINGPVQAQSTLASWVIFSDENGNVNFDWQIPFSGRFSLKVVGAESSHTAQVAVVTPVQISGNPSCASLNASSDPAFAHITSNYGFKIEPPISTTMTITNGAGRLLTGGAPSDPANSVTTVLQTDKILDWSATKTITAVILKNGSKANVYPYDPGMLSDAGLNTDSQNAISHIEFCFEATAPTGSITIIKDAQPNSPQTFNFEATGQINQNFGLVDNGVVGPDRITFNNLTGFGAGNTVTISENPSGGSFYLVQISCTSTGGTNNNLVNVQSRFVQIFLEPNEDVTCTFVNSVVTASYVSVTGRVTTETGRGLSRVWVTIQNTNTWETQTVLTNSFGRYRFDNLSAGDFYIISVNSKKYLFEPNTQSFVLDDFRENVDFSAITQ